MGRLNRFTVEAFDALAQQINEHVKVGAQVAVTGRLRQECVHSPSDCPLRASSHHSDAQSVAGQGYRTAAEQGRRPRSQGGGSCKGQVMNEVLLLRAASLARSLALTARLRLHRQL